MAPKGTGTLYVREELLERLWVNTAAAEWRNYKRKAYRFSNFGTSNLSVMVGLKAALEFFNTIGPTRIYQRAHELAGRVRDCVRKYPQLRLTNASADAFYGGMVSFEPMKGDLRRVMQECDARNIRIIGSPGRIRVSTHIFTQPTEVNAFCDAVERGLRA